MISHSGSDSSSRCDLDGFLPSLQKTPNKFSSRRTIGQYVFTRLSRSLHATLPFTSVFMKHINRRNNLFSIGTSNFLTYVGSVVEPFFKVLGGTNAREINTQLV